MNHLMEILILYLLHFMIVRMYDIIRLRNNSDSTGYDFNWNDSLSRSNTVLGILIHGLYSWLQRGICPHKDAFCSYRVERQ